MKRQGKRRKSLHLPRPPASISKVERSSVLHWHTPLKASTMLLTHQAVCDRGIALSTSPVLAPWAACSYGCRPLASPAPCPLKQLSLSPVAFLMLFLWSLGWPQLGVRHPGYPTVCDLGCQPSSGLSLSFPSLTPRADRRLVRSRPSGICCMIRSPSRNHRSSCCFLCPNLAFQRFCHSKAPVCAGKKNKHHPNWRVSPHRPPFFLLCRHDLPLVS